MKDKRNKHIKILAQKIVNIEKECSLGINVEENMLKLEEISKTLSLEEMFQLDEYITKKNLLTK